MVTKINSQSTKITFKVLVLNYVYADKHTEYTNIYKQCTVYTVHFHLHKPVKAEIFNRSQHTNLFKYICRSDFPLEKFTTNQNLK